MLTPQANKYKKAIKNVLFYYNFHMNRKMDVYIKTLCITGRSTCVTVLIDTMCAISRIQFPLFYRAATLRLAGSYTTELQLWAETNN